MHDTQTLINLLDLKNSMENLHSLLNGIYTKQQIANFKIIMVVKVGYKLNISKLYNLKKQKIHKICNKLIKNMQENSCNWVHRNTIYIDKVKRSE